MTQLDAKIAAFSKLGTLLSDYCKSLNNDTETLPNKDWLSKTSNAVILANQHNGWFTPENIQYCFENWSRLLNKKNLKEWLNSYSLSSNKNKLVAIIMAGNIPLVGFHDFLSVLLSGNSVLVKLSSNDKILLPFIAEYLIAIEPSLQDEIHFTEAKLEDFDAVIATGSDNTARYFEYYFGKKPNIIRKNRNSVAILTGKETTKQLEALSEDIFRYYGLGCRSVSKLFVPKGYNFDTFFKAMYAHHPIINQIKYANNYDYNKAVYLMSEFNILENGFLMLKEDESYASPIASVFYEFYDSIDVLTTKLQHDANKIQCIVANGVTPEEISFGQTQAPSLTDYADGVDVVEFLLKTS